MKKYFFKKTLAWDLIVGFALSFIYMAFLMLLDVVLDFTGLAVDRTQFSTVYAAVGTSLITLISILSGKFFAEHLNKNSEYEGDFSKYQYFYYILTIGCSFAITSLSRLISRICTVAFGENGIIYIVDPLISMVFGVIGIIVSVMCVRSLLCAVTGGEEAEKNYFSKAFLPLTVSSLVALVTGAVSTIFFNANLFDYISQIVYIAFYISLMALLKYKFDNEKIRKITCNIMPFVYFALCVVFRIVRL